MATIKQTNRLAKIDPELFDEFDETTDREFYADIERFERLARLLSDDNDND